jgi:hypothetical protein
MKLIKKFESYSQEREEMCKYLCNVCGCNMSELHDKSDEELEEMCRTMNQESHMNSYNENFNSMSREEMCNYLCRCGYNEDELDNCSEEELRMMCSEEEENEENDNEETYESKSKWIQDAIKKPGSLRKSLNKKKDEKISASEIDSELQALRGKDKDPKKKGVQGLSKRDLAKYRKLNLAKTLKGLKEHQDTQNYMFFGNLQTIKRLIDEMLEMDESKVDTILSNGHNWAVDHLATSKDDIEEVFNFLAGHDVPTEDHGHATHDGSFDGDDSEPSHEEMEGHLANKDLENEMKGIKSFNDFKK